MPRLYHLNKYTALRKELRNNPTKAENFLWRILRNRKFCGLKFRRQESIGRYIVDFYCPEKRLVVEVDGKIHNTHEQQEYDDIRKKFLSSCYIEVIRFSNDEVYYDIDSVLRKLKFVTSAPTPIAPP